MMSALLAARLVAQLGSTLGYGHLMELASALWKSDLERRGMSEASAANGAFVPVLLMDVKEERRGAAAAQRKIYEDWIRILREAAYP